MSSGASRAAANPRPQEPVAAHPEGAPAVPAVVEVRLNKARPALTARAGHVAVAVAVAAVAARVVKVDSRLVERKAAVSTGSQRTSACSTGQVLRTRVANGSSRTRSRGMMRPLLQRRPHPLRAEIVRAWSVFVFRRSRPWMRSRRARGIVR